MDKQVNFFFFLNKSIGLLFSSHVFCVRNTILHYKLPFTTFQCVCMFYDQYVNKSLNEIWIFFFNLQSLS